VTIVGHPIVREADGVAMSSRNAFLSADERTRARALSRGLRAASDAFAGGERKAGTLRNLVLEPVTAATTSIDYVTVAEPDALAPLDDGADVGERALIAIACRIGATRLIDNVVLGEDPPPEAGDA
jgi:pantoate--beta-alanine ligase